MIKANALNWKQYEAITKYIYETLGSQSGVTIKGYGSTCKVTGKSGVVHQIDVLTSHSDGVHEYLTAIECKFWKEKINKDTVMKVSGIIEDAGIDKGVIVSRRGFTRDGIAYAKHKNIGLVELREIEETDLEGKPTTFDVGVLEIHIKSILHRSEILHIETDAVETIQIVKESWRNKDIIRLSNGKQVSFTDYIREFQDELHLQKKIWQTITKRYEFPGGRFLHQPTNSSLHINAITFTGVLKKIDKSSTVEFTLVDQVWLIMKLLFENKTFTFSENGIIIENKSS